MSVGSNNLELIILSYLNNNDSYGYELVKKLNNYFEMEIKEVSVYTVIKRLEKKEFLIFYWDDENVGVKRKNYKISPKGVEYLQEYAQVWLKEVDAIKKFIKENNVEANYK